MGLNHLRQLCLLLCFGPLEGLAACALHLPESGERFVEVREVGGVIDSRTVLHDSGFNAEGIIGQLQRSLAWHSVRSCEQLSVESMDAMMEAGGKVKGGVAACETLDFAGAQPPLEDVQS